MHQCRHNMSEAEARQQKLELTIQHHCLVAKGMEFLLGKFGGHQGWVQLGQVRAAELLQLANLIILECCQVHHRPCVLLRLRHTCHLVQLQVGLSTWVRAAS